MFYKDDCIFKECEVVSVYDENGESRIKARLHPYDNDKTDAELSWCYPILPKHLQVNPKEGEMVLVILSRMGVAQSKRWFIGPIISQQYYLQHEPYLSAAGAFSPLPNPNNNPENNGTCPDREDVSIQGRKNADLVLKENEVRMRCGFLKDGSAGVENRLLFNREDLAYIQMKYKRMKGKNGDDFSSSINIVADRINLLSHDSRTPFTLNNDKELITDNELKKILKEAHPLVYGDDLIKFLKQFIEVFRTHTHPFAMDPPCLKTQHVNVLNTDMDLMLSQSVRIN